MALKTPEEARAEAAAEHVLVMDAARRFARRVGLEWGASEVYLFGSRARDEWRLGSDADLLVVADRLAAIGRHERSVLLRRLWEGSGGCDVLGFTAEEFEAGWRLGGIVAMALDAGALMLWPEEKLVQRRWRLSEVMAAGENT